MEPRKIALGAILSLVAGLVLIPNVSGAAETGKDVRVVNTAAEPVPVTGTVNVGNLPATQAVTGEVSVSNLPAVQSVRDVEAPHAQPIYIGSSNASVPIEEGAFAGTDTFTVPEGKRLVVEHASSLIDLPSGQVPQLVAVDTNRGGPNPVARLVLMPELMGQSTTHWRLSEEVTAYFEAGDTLTFIVSRFPHTEGLGRFTWSLYGYLVDL